MMMNQPQLKAEKVTAAKKVLEDLNSLLPALDYQAGLYTFAPYGALVRNAKWDRGAMAKGIGQISADKDVFGRMTNMGDGFLDHAAAISAMKGRKALIIASDGENNKGSDPVGEARKLLQANPDLCLHIISVADSAEGQATLDAIARLKGCTVMAKAGDLLADDAAMRKFAEGVFYDKKMDDVIVLRGVNFAFNSDNLDHRAQGILNEVAAAIKAKPSARVLLNGYTDHFGTDKYNLGLSQRRADSVKAYLVRQGIPASRMTTHGKGKSFTYDNKTEEGCYLNRRVEFVFAE
jgi:OOP family OmpA-OmpF porin